MRPKRAIDSPALLGSAAALFLLVGATALAFGYNLGRISLWDPDEPRGAAIALEMLSTGDWIHLRYNGEPVTARPALVKPPLYYWSIAAASTLRGRVDEFSARLPSAAAGAATTLLVWLLARRLVGPRGALLAGLVFATNHMIFEQARSAEIDMTLCLLVTGALVLFERWYREGGPLLPAYALAGLAVLAKGPVGFLLPALIVGVFLVLRRDPGAAARMRPVAGLLVLAAVAAPWYLVAGKAFGAEFFLRQNLERFFHAFDHRQPWYYYLEKLPVHFLPWTLFLPLALVRGPAGRGERTGRLFLWTWVLVTLGFFSLSQSKRSLYIVPLYPALSILVAAGLEQALWNPAAARARAWLRRGLVLLMLLLWAAAAAAAVFMVRFSVHGLGTSAALVLLGLAAWSWAAARAVRRDATRALAACLLVAALGWEILAAGVVYPELDRRSRSSREMCEAVAATVGTTTLATVGFHPPSAVFYLQRARGVPFLDLGYDLDRGVELLRGPEPAFCLMARALYARARPRLPDAEVVALPGVRLSGWKWDVVLLRNRAARPRSTT